MIQRGVHQLTKEPRVVVECDRDDCERSEYLPDEITHPSQAVSMLRRAGWQTRAPQPALVETYEAMCPTHSTTERRVCTHEDVATVGRATYCRQCGKQQGWAA